MISAPSLLAAALIQAAVPPAAAPAPAPAAAAPWAVTERAGQTPGTGSVSAAASVPEGRLVVRCDRAAAPVVSIQFIPRERMRGFGQQPVSLQFDGATPLIDNWEMMGAGVVEREERAAATLSFNIAHARAIRLRTVDRAGAPVDIAFAGPTGDAAIRRVVEACGHPLALPAPPAAPAPAAPPPQS